MFRIKFLVFIMVLFAIGTIHGQTKTDLSVAEFEEAIQSTKDVVIVDLRTPDEVASGIIPGAIVIDYFAKDFESKIASLDSGKTYLLYCASGGRSSETLDMLRTNQFKKVYHLQGGMNAWKKAKKPVEPYKPQ